MPLLSQPRSRELVRIRPLTAAVFAVRTAHQAPRIAGQVGFEIALAAEVPPVQGLAPALDGIPHRSAYRCVSNTAALPSSSWAALGGTWWTRTARSDCRCWHMASSRFADTQIVLASTGVRAGVTLQLLQRAGCGRKPSTQQNAELKQY